MYLLTYLLTSYGLSSLTDCRGTVFNAARLARHVIFANLSEKYTDARTQERLVNAFMNNNANKTRQLRHPHSYHVVPNLLPGPKE